ncbi:MAG: S8 family serine peptidase [Actinomycetota bacterium]
MSRRTMSCLLGFILALGSLPLLGGPAGATRIARLDDLLATRLRAASASQEIGLFVHATDIGKAKRAVASAGMKLARTWNRIGVAVASGTPAQIRKISALEGVTYLEADQPITFFTDTSHNATRGNDAIQNLEGADGQPLDGRGVSVAVIDSGVDGTHPDFQDRVIKNLKYACQPAASNPATGYCFGGSNHLGTATGAPVEEYGWVDITDITNDTDTPSAGGHGTHVAGIIAGNGTVNGRPYHGAAPGASIVGLSVGGTLLVSAGGDGLYWVLENHDKVNPPIRVINNSWGPLGGTYDPEDALMKMSDALVEGGVAIAWAAGNSGGDGTSSTTTMYAQNPTPGVVMVANFSDANTGTRDGTIDSSSSRGATSDRSTWPDVSAPGTAIMSTCRPTLAVCYGGGEGPDLDNPDLYASLSGTSMAAPHVAGIMAQLYQADPEITPRDIEETLEDTAYRFEFGAHYNPDPRNADDYSSFDKGHGLVDVVAAVEAIPAVKNGGSVGREPTVAPPTSAVKITRPAAGTDPTGTTSITGTAVAGKPWPTHTLPPEATTYFLHNTGGACAEGNHFMTTEDSPGDQDGCGWLAVSWADYWVGVLGTGTETYPAVPPPTGAILKTQTALATLYMTTEAAGYYEFDVSLLDGSTPVATAAGSAIVEAVSATYTPVEVEIPVPADVQLSEGLSLRVAMAVGSGNWYWGYEGDHASRLQVTLARTEPAAASVSLRVIGDGFDSGPISATSTDAFATWEAPFDFASLPAGPYTVSAGLLAEATVVATDEVTVTVPPTQVSKTDTVLSLARSDTKGKEKFTFYTATLAEVAGRQIAGRAVDFAVDGQPVGTAVTGQDGTATIKLPPQPKDAVAVVTFAGDGVYNGSSATHDGKATGRASSAGLVRYLVPPTALGLGLLLLMPFLPRRVRRTRRVTSW